MSRLIINLFMVTIAGLLSYTAVADSGHFAQSPQLEYFPSLPKVIDNCSGVYTYDSVPLKSEKFIFVDNLKSVAFIKVNGKEIELKKSKDLVLPGGKKIRAVYRGSGYKVTLVVRQITQAGVGAANLEATLQVKYGDSSTEYKIHGHAGC